MGGKFSRKYIKQGWALAAAHPSVLAAGERYRNRRHIRLTLHRAKLDAPRVAPALPMPHPGDRQARKHRYDIAHVGNLFRP